MDCKDINNHFEHSANHYPCPPYGPTWVVAALAIRVRREVGVVAPRGSVTRVRGKKGVDSGLSRFRKAHTIRESEFRGRSYVGGNTSGHRAK